MDYKIKTTVTFSEEQFKDWIADADIEYWISGFSWREDGTFSLTVAGDGEEDDRCGQRHKISHRDMLDGLQQMANRAPAHFANLVSGEYDSETGDVLIQFCCFGEIVYG